MGIRLVDDVKSVRRYSSTRIAFVLALMSLLSPWLSTVWIGMPEEIKAWLPVSWRLGISLAVGFMTIIGARHTTTRPKLPHLFKHQPKESACKASND